MEATDSSPVSHGTSVPLWTVRLWSQAAPWATFLALALAASAQWTLIAKQDGIPLPDGVAGALQPIWPDPGAVVLAILQIMVAITLFASSLRTVLQEALIQPQSVPSSTLSRALWPTLLLCLVGLGLQAAVLFQLAQNSYDGAQPRWFALSLALVIIGLGVNERSNLRALIASLTAHRWHVVAEGIYVVAMTGIFLGLNARDIASWFYTGLGDEYSFYGASLNFAHGDSAANLFSQHGAYDVIPYLSSYVEGKLMVVLGINSFGWKMSITLQAALALVALYILTRVFYDRRVAILALGLLVTSHYLLAYAHTGYPNLEIFLPTIVPILFFYLGIRQSSWLCLLLSGIGAGLGWYTYYPSRTTIIIVIVAVLVTVQPRSWLKVGSWIVAGFGMLFLPMLIVNGGTLISAMLAQSGSTNTTPVANHTLLPVWNLGRSLLAFNYNTYDGGPYVYGSLAEPITAALFLLGLGYVLSTWRDVRSRILLCWFVLGTITTGVLSKYDHVSVSRLLYQLPVVAICAALAFDRALQVITSFYSTQKQQLFMLLAVAGLIGAVAYSNLYRWYVEMPAHLPSGAEAVLLRTVLDSRCRAAPLPALLVADTIGGELAPELDSVGASNDLQLAAYGAPPTWMSTVPQRCVLFRSRTDPQSLALLHAVLQRWPHASVVTEGDRTGMTLIPVIYPQHS